MASNSFFLWKLEEVLFSAVSGEISVYTHEDRIKIVAGGLVQSGSVIEDLWKRPFSHLKPKNPKKILLLGLGAGSLLSLVSATWPSAKVSAVEIDPVMIDIAARYSKAATYPKLTIYNQDAKEWLTKSKERFSTIIVDLYCGNTIPQFVYQEDFVRMLRSHLTSQGVVVINHLYFDSYTKQAEDFTGTLDAVFQSVKLVRAGTNMFFICTIIEKIWD